MIPHSSMAATWFAAFSTLSLYTLSRAATTVSPGSLAANATTPPPFSFSISEIGVNTNHIEIQFDIVPANHTIVKYLVTAQKKDSDSVIISPEINNTVTTYTIDDLMTDSEYEICATATVKNSTGEFEVQDCLAEETIPLIRADSLYILFIVLGYFIIMVLIGIICWKCNTPEEDEVEIIENEEGAK